MKRILLVLLAVTMMFSVSALAFGTPATTEAATVETEAVPTGDPAALSLPEFPNVVLNEIALPDGSKLLYVIAQLDDETKATADADKPAVFSALEAENSPVKLAGYTFVYYDEVAKGGRKLVSKMYEVEGAVWTNLTVPKAKPAGGEEGGTPAAGEKHTLGKYEFTVTEVKLSKTYDDKPLVTIVYDFTNNGDETTSAGSVLSFKAFQDGVEIDTGYASDDSGKSYKDLKPGATITGVTQSFVPQSENALTIEVTEWLNFDSDETVELHLDYPTN